MTDLTTEDLPNLQDSGNLDSFDEVREEVERLADLNFADRVVDMTSTHVTEQLDFWVDGVGVLEMTPWAKGQIGASLGVKWDKWFNPDLVSYKEVQGELQRRFKAGDFSFMVRSRKHEEAKARSHGILRAFLSPGYQRIDDRRLLDCVSRSEMGQHLDEVSFMGWGPHRTRFTDKSSHLTALFPDPVPVPVGGGDPEPHWHGFRIRNSEVGFSAITIEDFWFRLVCTNGMIAAVDGNHLFYRRHIQIEDEALEMQMSDVWNNLIARRDWTKDRMLEASSEEMERPLEGLRSFLRRRNAPKYFIEAATEEYEREPVATRYGLSQAITAAAKRVDDVDKRLEMERLGGRFLLAA